MYSFFAAILGVGLICASISAVPTPAPGTYPRATEQCAKETGIPPQCISAFKGHFMELMSHRPPHSCIRDAANAFPKIQKEKALTKVKAQCLDNHVSASECAEMFGIPKECKPSFEMIGHMAASVEPVCQDWVVNAVEMYRSSKSNFRALQCLLE